MNETWNRINVRHYKAMIHRHIPLWEYLSSFIKQHDITTLADVGGGMGYAAQFVKPENYTLFDRNEKMIEYAKQRNRNAIHGDFTTADVSNVVGVDMVLCLAVVEHAGVLESFIKKIVEINPRYALVSFFRGYSKSGIKKVKNNCVHRIYSQQEVQDLMDQLGLQDQAILFSLVRDPDKEYLKHTLFDGLLLLTTSRHV